MIYYNGQFDAIVNHLHHGLMGALPVDTGHWQSLEKVPHTATRELQHVHLEIPIPRTREAAQEAIQPNLPWAEDHFQERVGGVPTNPGEQYMNWPWYDPNWAAQGKERKFSHTYQERMWAREAGWVSIGVSGRPRRGIRYQYGDLEDVVNLLQSYPTTRQAFLPIWFPEDTGAHHGERVPCTLGYHFMLRNGLLDVTYFIRSCDFLRYLRDDIYMAMRLGQWMLDTVSTIGSSWEDVVLGELHMHIISLHVFEGDMPKMRREAPPTP